ncbi:MAG: hypothetical protein QOG42_1326 [Solirubrobacteraceae bacterium]|nr:hypothetical protein [Solirubrobacteraceae bacterium]
MKPTALSAVLVALACVLAACGGGGDDKSAGGGGDGAAPPPARQAAFAVGIGEQGAAMFTDKRFLDLGLDKARLVVPYDAVARRTERELADLWLASAKQASVEPFITFGHSRAHPAKLPSVAQYRAAFRAFRKRYPEVHVYAPWNEINHVSQPTARSPRRAAEFYNVVKAECHGCTVLAGDVLDQAGMTRYVRRYRRHLDGTPSIWGLHNYADTNRFRTTGLRDLLRTVSGEVWLTETGGIVKFGRSFPRDERRAARSVTYALKLAADHPRVKRVYLYNWTGAKPADRFDSGLIGSDGTARPGYDALRAGLEG